MTAHLRNLTELNETIEREVTAAMIDKRGCFGTLLYEATECAVKYAATKTIQMTKISDECLKIEQQFDSKPEIKAAAKAPAAEPVKVDVEALVINNRKAAIDWVAVINLIIEKRPNNYKYLLMIVKAQIGHLVPKGNVYDYTRRLVDGLKKQRAIDWNGDKK